MDAETLFPLIGLLLALAVAVGGLRGHLHWKRWSDEREDRARRDRKDQDYGGPWGGG